MKSSLIFVATYRPSPLAHALTAHSIQPVINLCLVASSWGLVRRISALTKLNSSYLTSQMWSSTSMSSSCAPNRGAYPECSGLVSLLSPLSAASVSAMRGRPMAATLPLPYFPPHHLRIFTYTPLWIWNCHRCWPPSPRPSNQEFWVWMEEGLDLQASATPIHLESLTIEAFGTYEEGSEVHIMLCDPRSRIVLTGLRHLAFVSKDSMLPTACSILRASADSIDHLEFRFLSESPWSKYSTNPYFGRPLNSHFPHLQTITFIFPSAPHPARISRVPGILILADGLGCPSLSQVVLRFNIRVQANKAWCDTGFTALDAALSRISTLSKVSILIRIVTRGKHSIADHSALIRSTMPLTETRGILCIERVFPV